MANVFYTSEGEKITQRTIRSRLALERKDCLVKMICECCYAAQSFDLDHTISQLRCKNLHKSELIWMEGNWSWSCRDCHIFWESYKSGKFQYHKNFKKRMTFTAMHDYNGFMARFHYVTNLSLIKFCESLMFPPDPEF